MSIKILELNMTKLENCLGKLFFETEQIQGLNPGPTDLGYYLVKDTSDQFALTFNF